MNDCKKIEPLLYLFRDGELSEDDRKDVLGHMKTCPGCARVLSELRSIDAALAPLRERLPELSGASALVEETMDLIADPAAGRRGASEGVSILDVMSVWLRPALGTVLAAAVILFIAQQSRDTMKIEALEKQLKGYGTTALTRGPSGGLEGLSPSDVASLDRLHRSSIGGSPLNLVGSGLLDIFRQNTGLFEEFKRRYPALASIKLEEGVGERERKILATEGKAFMKEFEKLLQEGEQ